jgi:hypothetical protein
MRKYHLSFHQQNLDFLFFLLNKIENGCFKPEKLKFNPGTFGL